MGLGSSLKAHCYIRAVIRSIPVANVPPKNRRKKPNNQITYHRPPLNLNIGMVIFLVILIYVVYSLVRYVTQKHVVGYEVRTGALESNEVYKGIALRKEEVVGSKYSGHINYYTREGDRLAANKLAYTVDESGEVAQAISQEESDQTVFSSDDYANILTDVTEFSSEFKPGAFNSVYEFKTDLSSTVQKITNNSILSDIERIGDDSSIHYCNSDNTGYIVYNTDGYEGLTFDALTHADFDETNYQKSELDNNRVVAEGDAAYKLETAEDWSIAVELKDDATARELEDAGVVTVRFLKNQLESYATVTTKKDADGRNYANLSLTNSMMTFCTDRFLNIEIITDNTKGLKIPVSSLVDDDFYVVPADFVTEGTGGTEQVLRQMVNDAGEQTTETVTVTPYGTAKDGSYYVDKDALRDGDVLLKLNSTGTYTIGKTVSLQGVYNINEGYANFRQVSVVRQNDEYAIVQPDSMFGLREYDYIVLDAATMTPDEFIYE